MSVFQYTALILIAVYPKTTQKRPYFNMMRPDLRHAALVALEPFARVSPNSCQAQRRHTPHAYDELPGRDGLSNMIGAGIAPQILPFRARFSQPDLGAALRDRALCALRTEPASRFRPGGDDPRAEGLRRAPAIALSAASLRRLRVRRVARSSERRRRPSVTSPRVRTRATKRLTPRARG
jgi:hypothetical protein